MTRQKTILLTLVGVLVMAIFYAYFQYPRQSRLSGESKVKRFEPPRSVGRKAGASEENKFQIRFDWLKNLKTFSGAKQDLFGPLYGDKKESSPVPGKKKVPSLDISKAVEKPDVSVPSLELLGYLASEKNKTFFLSQGDDLFVAKKGVNFGKQKEYRITQVTSKEIKINKQGEPELLTISLVAKPPGSGFNTHQYQNIKKAFLPSEDVSPPKVPDKTNEVPLNLDNGAGEEQPPGRNIDPGGDWEK